MLKEGETHYFMFVQPDEEQAPVKVRIERHGTRALRRILVDYIGGSYDLTQSAAGRFRAKYRSYYESNIDRKLLKKLHIPGGKTHLCMSVLAQDVGDWLYRASRMILTAGNLEHCASEYPELQAAYSKATKPPPRLIKGKFCNARRGQ